METVTVNLVGKTRRVTLGGREFLVAPLTLIVPGVLNGSQGALYYPPEEIGKNPSAWNGVPILLNHPTTNGQHVSGRTPVVWEKQLLGHVFNASVTAAGKLVGEGWFDISAVKRVDNRVLAALEAGRSISLSTGLFTQNEPAPQGAAHNGRAYTHIARGYSPDHLAILPDQAGACSIQDGCGVLVNEAQAKGLVDRVLEWLTWSGIPGEHTANAFCSTGEGGGVDPSCGSGGGSGGGEKITREGGAGSGALSSQKGWSMTREVLDEVAKGSAPFRAAVAVKFDDVVGKSVRAVVGKDAQEDAKGIAKGIFARMTLGTGPVAIGAIRIGAKIAPKAFDLLARGLGGMGKAMGWGQGKAVTLGGGGAAGARARTAHNAAVDNADEKVDEAALKAALEAMQEFQDLMDDPAEAKKFADALLAIKQAPKTDETDEATANSNSEEEAYMDRDKTIGWLTANCDCWKGAQDRTVLNGLPDDKLTALQAAAEKDRQRAGILTALEQTLGASGLTTNAEEMTAAMMERCKAALAAEKPAANATPPAAPAPRPLTDNEWFQSAPVGVQSVLKNALAIERQAKVAIVSQLTDNAARRDRLLTLPLDDLRERLAEAQAYAEAHGVPASTTAPEPVYWGAAGGPTGNAGKDDSDNVLPVFAANFEEMASPRLRQKQA